MKSRLQVFKIGGKLINDSVQLSAFLEAFAALEGRKILVHGGGSQATELSNRLGVPTQMVDGRRITTSDDLDIVTMVYAGLVNKTIVASLQKWNCNAIGLTGADGNTITAAKRPVMEIDYGWVGDIQAVNANSITSLLSNGLVPVFPAICHDGNGQLLNTNADTIAAEVAIALSDDYDVELNYCFEKRGVLRDIDDEGSVLTTLDRISMEELTVEGVIHQGMLPKLTNCFYAIESGVSRVRIGGADLANAHAQVCTTITKVP